MRKKRKEKKLNMQGKDNMVLDYFIIYTHSTHEKKGGWLQFFQFPKAYTFTTEKEGKGSHEGEGKCSTAKDSFTITQDQIHTRSIRGGARVLSPIGHLHQSSITFTHSSTRGIILFLLTCKVWDLLFLFIKMILFKTMCGRLIS